MENIHPEMRSIGIHYEREWTTVTKLKWTDSLKSLVISCMDEPEFSTRFPNKSNYVYYWSKLIKFMKEEYDLHPEKPDKFIFLLLLTYPRKYIIHLHSFLQLKIAFNELVHKGSSENSDFTCIGYYYGQNDNCICSQHIENIYEFQNNLSLIVFNVGSVCNNRHKVVSDDDEDYKLMQRAERDRRNDNKNGWTEGTTEINRIKKKHKRDEIVNCKRTRKAQLNSSENDIPNNSYITDTICYVCNKTKIFSQSSKGVKGICSCIPAIVKCKNKKIFKELLKNVERIVCKHCNQETKKINDGTLCFVCKDTHKISTCFKCFTMFSQSICVNEEYCNNCLDTIKKCIDCSKPIISPETYIIRCKPCYKKTIIPCKECDNPVKIQTVKKEGKNKGKIFYNCNNCDLFVWL